MRLHDLSRPCSAQKHPRIGKLLAAGQRPFASFQADFFGTKPPVDGQKRYNIK
jgi:hypothetical protein